MEYANKQPLAANMAQPEEVLENLVNVLTTDKHGNMKIALGRGGVRNIYWNQ
jgi:hypothetical protein